MLDEHNPDIVMVIATWLDPSIPSSDIIPTNYSVYRKDSKLPIFDRKAGQTGDGVMIAVCNNLLSSACPDLDTDCELVWAKIELLGARNLYVGATLYTPSANNTLLGLEQSLQKLRNSNSVVWLGGDFNLPNIDWEDNAVKPDTVCWIYALTCSNTNEQSAHQKRKHLGLVLYQQPYLGETYGNDTWYWRS